MGCLQVKNATYYILELGFVTVSDQERFGFCSDDVSRNWKDSPSSVLNIYHELIAAGLRIWVFRSLYFYTFSSSYLPFWWLNVFFFW